MTYKLLTYQDRSGPRSGILVDTTVYDAAKVLGQPAYASMRAILDDWQTAGASLAKAADGKLTDGIALSGLELLPPVLYPGAIYCAGANYRDHVDNMARRLNIPPEPDPHELGLSPWHFIKSSWCAVGDNAKVELASDVSRLGGGARRRHGPGGPPCSSRPRVRLRRRLHDRQ